MKKIIVLSILFSSCFSFAQEELQPLRYNGKLINEKAVLKSSALHESIFYIFDTLSLPFFDDFSRDHFKKFDAQVGDANVLDSTWFTFSIGGVPDPWGTSYMTDTTFRYEIDTVPGYGFDSLITTAIALLPSLVDVSDLNFYPVTFVNTEVWPSGYIVDSLWTALSPDISIPEVNPDLLQDSLTIYFAVEQASEVALWEDNFAYRNDTYPLNPHSIGVATFDGIDDVGYPYDWSANSGLADYLTSKPIDLSNTVDSVYFSFMYEPGGLGEKPESTDSLVLQFWSPVTSQWSSIWKATGTVSTTFSTVLIPVNSPLYKQKGFQFRFINYGSLKGSLDHWHIDYVELDDFRSYDDVYQEDWAFQFPAPSLIDEFTSMPWKHYRKNDSITRMKTSTTVKTYNSDVIDKFVVAASCSMDLFLDGTPLNTIGYVNPGNVTALSVRDMNYTIPSSYWFEAPYADTFATFDIRYLLNTTTNPKNFENDTLWQKQEFRNYYSYDDGTAEAAYGIVGIGAEMAYKFTMPAGITDTIKAVSMYFAASVTDASTDPFFIQIWDDIAGQPGNIIYTTDDVNLPVTFLPEYSYGVNGFYEYTLPAKVARSGTFYVGWRQTTTKRLNVGFDKNLNNQTKIFYNTGSGWTNTGFQGSLMVRPVFTSGMDAIWAPVSSFTEELAVEIYPNPANDRLTVEVTDDFEGEIRFFDLQGKLVKNEYIYSSSQIDISFIPEGFYIVQIIDFEGNSSTQKLSVSR